MVTSLLIHLHYIALIQIIAAYFYNDCAYDCVSVGHDKWQNVNKENLQENITHTARSLHISYSLSHTFLVVICTDVYIYKYEHTKAHRAKYTAHVVYRGFPTRMVYLYYISCLRYTILVGNPRYVTHIYCLVCVRLFSNPEHVKTVVSKLTNMYAMKKARVHPFRLLVAQHVYSKGSGELGSLYWIVSNQQSWFTISVCTSDSCVVGYVGVCACECVCVCV